MAYSTDTEGTDGIVGSLTARTRLVDGFVLLAVPAMLGATFLLPAGFRRSLAFEYTDPSFLTAYTANFVHLDGTHLLMNVIVYALVVPVVYALEAATGQRRRFFAVSLTFLTVFPVVLSYMNLVFVRSAYAVGFSGVLMAFVGYQLFALAEFLDVHFDVGPRGALAQTLFFLSIGLIAPLSVRAVVPENPTVTLGTGGLVFVAFLSAVLSGLDVEGPERGIRVRARAAVNVSGLLELLVVAVLLVLALPFVAFPADPFTDEGVLNLYVHFLGYALGFMVTFVTVEATPRLLPGGSSL